MTQRSLNARLLSMFMVCCLLIHLFDSGLCAHVFVYLFARLHVLIKIPSRVCFQNAGPGSQTRVITLLEKAFGKYR